MVVVVVLLLLLLLHADSDNSWSVKWSPLCVDCCGCHLNNSFINETTLAQKERKKMEKYKYNRDILTRDQSTRAKWMALILIYISCVHKRLCSHSLYMWWRRWFVFLSFFFQFDSYYRIQSRLVLGCIKNDARVYANKNNKNNEQRTIQRPAVN